MSIRALERMYRPGERLFCFCLRRKDGCEVQEGISHRYTATVLLALADLDHAMADRVLHGQPPEEVCRSLIRRVEGTRDLGAVALVLWAARALNHPGAADVLRQLQSMQPDVAVYPTVEVAWSLTALVVPGRSVGDDALADRLARRLITSCHPQSHLFSHHPHDTRPSRLRGHVACFADLVYPIHALCWYHHATGDREALQAARHCGSRMCELQGPAGQWWWHYDVRTGRVIERYPVYSVHQDAMGPMALLALKRVGVSGLDQALARSLQWLEDPPELEHSLIDRERGVIWRKAYRAEPGKLVRTLQAGLSRVHPRLRVPGVDLLFPPGRVDFESRPYHMAWILYAWSA